MSATEHRNFGRQFSGRIHMPGNMMTKAGKRMQMVKDNARESPRRGRRHKPSSRKRAERERRHEAR